MLTQSQHIMWPSRCILLS